MFDPNLFLVVLGGRTKSSHIELHDVRWVIGTTIEDTFPTLRKEWFGLQKGLHIDSYIRIKYIDGYKVNIEKKSETSYKNNSIVKSSANHDSPKLWFINLGGYCKNKMSEEHQFGLIVAKTVNEAKSRAKSQWLIGSEQKHKDDVEQITKESKIDNLHLLSDFHRWYINLTADSLTRNQKLIPDWYGYKRID